MGGFDYTHPHCLSAFCINNDTNFPSIARVAIKKHKGKRLTLQIMIKVQ